MTDAHTHKIPLPISAWQLLENLDILKTSLINLPLPPSLPRDRVRGKEGVREGGGERERVREGEGGREREGEREQAREGERNCFARDMCNCPKNRDTMRR